MGFLFLFLFLFLFSISIFDLFTLHLIVSVLSLKANDNTYKANGLELRLVKT